MGHTILPPPSGQQILTAQIMNWGASTTNFAQTLQLGTVETESVSVLVKFMECLLLAVNTTNPTIELGIYAWNTAGNGALLSSGTVVPTAIGFWQVTLATPVLLAPRTKYYLAYLNRNSGDATTLLATFGSNASSTLLAATLNSQAVMPANLSSLSTSGAPRLALRAWS